MTPRHYHHVDNGTRSRQYTHLERNRGPRVASQPMPELPQPFTYNDDCHYTLIHDEITCTLFYDRQCQQWNLRFDWPGIQVGYCNTFDRDTPALEMRHLIVRAIEARWGDDWMTDNLPGGEQSGETVPGCYGIGAGEY